jgi:hypothetical protein
MAEADDPSRGIARRANEKNRRGKPVEQPRIAAMLCRAIPLHASMDLAKKLEILADAAKYDASCASSGAARKDSRDGLGVGSTGGAGICHSYTPDGRCVSLLKVLLTNRSSTIGRTCPRPS